MSLIEGFSKLLRPHTNTKEEKRKLIPTGIVLSQNGTETRLTRGGNDPIRLDPSPDYTSEAPFESLSIFVRAEKAFAPVPDLLHFVIIKKHLTHQPIQRALFYWINDENNDYRIVPLLNDAAFDEVEGRHYIIGSHVYIENNGIYGESWEITYSPIES